MDNEVADNHFVPSEVESTDMDDLFGALEGTQEFQSHDLFNDGGVSTGAVGDHDSADAGSAAAHAIVSEDEALAPDQVGGSESLSVVLPNHDEQHEDMQMRDEPTSANTVVEGTAHDVRATAPDTAAVSYPDQNSVGVEDSTSLFIPEHYPSSQPPASVPPTAPQRHASTPNGSPAPNLSLVAKLKAMQKRARNKQNALMKQKSASQQGADPDSEAYLKAVSSGGRSVEVDEYEREHRKALAEYQKQQKFYEKLKEQHNGRLPSLRENIEWMRIQGAEEARLKKRQRDLAGAQEDDEEDVFPRVNTHADEHDGDSHDDYSSDGRPPKRRRGNQSAKQTSPVSIQDAELESMRVALEATEDAPKKKEKKKGKEEGGLQEGQRPEASRGSRVSKAKATRPSRAKGAAKASARRPRKTAKDKRELEHATKQATSLFNANVFEQQAGVGAADQPTFTTRKKADVLAELISSVPVQDKKQVRNDMNILLQASKDFDGRGSCKVAPGGNWLVRGMKTSLKGYQVLGSAFMRRRENDAQEPRGGLLADQMGLGKTLMMLANIVNSRDSMIRREDRSAKTTLLVASPALLTQWASEIEQHTDCNLKVLRYGAGTRIDSTHAVPMLCTHDIVLTTYSEVMKSYPKNEPPIECQTAEQKIAWWKETYETHRGVLHQTYFKRVVLDEAQAIKNYQGRTSIACRALMAAHKWAVSGTPILNRLVELYPYFKFLNVPHTGSYRIFKHNYCGSGEGEENAERLLVRLSQFMIRRTHADRMFNAPILKLPQANQSTYWCEFNSVERSIYAIVQQRFANKINMWSKNGTLAKSYSNVLVMLLRLRQLTAHVLMLQFVMRDLLEREDIERIKEVVKEQASHSRIRQGRTILAIRKQLEAHELQERKKAAAKATRRLAAEEAAREANTEYVEPEDDDDDFDDDGPVQLGLDGDVDEGGEEDEGASTGRGTERNKSGKTFGKSYDFNPYVKSLTVGEDWEEKKDKARCGECGRCPTKPWMTACGHLMCEACYENVMNAAAQEDKTHGTCKACGSTFAACAPIDEEADDVPAASCGGRGKTAQKKKKEKERIENEDIKDDWLSLGGKNVLPSAKTIAIKAQILNWTRENPSVKIIIYTQFLAMIRILAKICKQEGWRTEQYHGKVSLSARDKAIKRFADSPRSSILLASLRCGGLGLNLTMASKVIIMDPWWNQASEQQAFCRVFRIGQQDETFMSRMCVKNTVDERLIDMQREKQREIDEVMEDHGKKTKHLEIADLMRLFGNIDDTGDGRPFLMVNNTAAAGGFHADGDHEGYADEF